MRSPGNALNDFLRSIYQHPGRYYQSPMGSDIALQGVSQMGQLPPTPTNNLAQSMGPQLPPQPEAENLAALNMSNYYKQHQADLVKAQSMNTKSAVDIVAGRGKNIRYNKEAKESLKKK